MDVKLEEHPQHLNPAIMRTPSSVKHEKGKVFYY